MSDRYKLIASSTEHEVYLHKNGFDVIIFAHDEDLRKHVPYDMSTDGIDAIATHSVKSNGRIQFVNVIDYFKHDDNDDIEFYQRQYTDWVLYILKTN